MASTQALVDVVTAALPSPPLPPPLYIPPPVDRRDDVPKTEIPPRKRLCLPTRGSRYEVEESFTTRPTRGRGIDYGFVSTVDAEARRRGIREVGYGIRDTWVDLAEAVPEIAPMTLGEVNTRVTELAGLHEHDTQDLYALLEDAQDSVYTQFLAPCTSDTATVTGYSYSDTTQGEIKKLEIALWNLKVKGNDVPTYTERFQELTLICMKFVVNETEKIDKYISGLPDNIYGSVKSSKPKTLDETIENNHGHQQQPSKRQNVAKVYNMGSGEKKPYRGNFPKSSDKTNIVNAWRYNRAIPKGNVCFECEAPGHFKKDCPKLKNMDGGNANAQGWVYAVRNA
nr:hypothetical protein [Tanacetum cinerariifolium]